MKFGFFTMPIHPLDRDYVETLKEDREAFILADRLGYSEAYCGEHLTDKAENITSSMLFLATLIHETKQMKLCTGTTNLTHTHPVLAASHAAMMDHMLEGRFMFGISPGALATDMEVLEILDVDRNEMFAESIDTIIKIWTTDAPYDIKGKLWNVSSERTIFPEIGMGYLPKPFQKPHPPILGTVVAPYSKGVIEMGKKGFLPISANFLQPKWVATHWANYKQGCEEGGRPANPADWRVARSIFVADDDKVAQSYGKDDANSPYRFYYNQLLQKLVAGGRGNVFKLERDQPDEEITLEYVLDSLVITGTVNSVVDQILAFREEAGDFGTLLYAGKDWTDPALGKRSMELLATEVMPRVNEAIGESAEAAE